MIKKEEKRKKLIDWFVNDMAMIRKKFGVSQTELGKMIGVSRQTISSLERKEVALTWDKYLALMFSLYKVSQNNMLDAEFKKKYNETVECIKG